MPEPAQRLEVRRSRSGTIRPYRSGIGSGAFDDEGSPHSRRAILERGRVVSGLYDALHGAAFDLPSTGNASREGTFTSESIRFAHSPQPGTSNLSWEPGDGGTDEELIEAVGEGSGSSSSGTPSPMRSPGRSGARSEWGIASSTENWASRSAAGSSGVSCSGVPGSHRSFAP